ncbi:MAG TPA: hypothetical protein VGR91_08050 [Stellaceae bacterium]|nr:hypothetical protein [Stellaceae bacterium]
MRDPLLTIARHPAFWRGMAASRRVLAEHVSDARIARDYEEIAAALDRGEALPPAAEAFLRPAVRP